jgi:hypothetical protein
VKDRPTMSSALYYFLARVAFAFEPISPRFISFFIRRRLNDWKKEGAVEDFKVKTKRISKFHYKVTVDLDFTPRQTRNILANVLTRLPRIFRR